MESKTLTSNTNIKTIHLDGSSSIDSKITQTKVKSTKGRKKVLKVNDFKLASDTARYTKDVGDIELPPNFISKSIEVATVKTYTRNIKQLNHQDVEYNGNKYTVCYVLHNMKPVLFIIDTNIKEKVVTNGVGVHDGYPKIISGPYIHQLIMGNPPSNKYSVDHLNRIRRDNRKCNLAFKTASEQLQNQFIRDRKNELPKDCGIEHNDIPKHVIYKNQKDRGELFEIEISQTEQFKHIPISYLIKKTTSRPDVSLLHKLQIAIYYLRWLCQKFPELKSVIRINKEDEEDRLNHTKEYNDIISLTTYPKEVIHANLVDFIYDCKTDYSIDNEEIIEKIVKNTEAGKKKEDNLPTDCGVNKIDIPKYCYYVPAKELRGDSFVIDSHPKLLETGKRQIATPGTKLLTTKQKFDILLEYIRCLENNLPIPKYDGPKGIRGQFTDIKKKETPVKPIVENIDKPSSADNAIDVDTKDIPRYVYYKQADKEHGSYWIIKEHPNLASRNIKTKNSRTSALLSDREKFQEILCHLESLERGTPFKEYKVVRAVKNSVHKDKSPKRVPDNWDLERYPISDYLYYCPQTDKRGDSWIIKGHPKQTKASITTSTSMNKSTLDKYLDAMAILSTVQ